MYLVPKPLAIYVLKNIVRSDRIFVGRKALITYLANSYLFKHLRENKKAIDLVMSRLYPFRDYSRAWELREMCWVEDIGGNPILPYTLIQEVNTLKNQTTYVYRHTGYKRRFRFKNYYRYPGTTAEIRQNQNIDDDEPEARSARKAAIMPDAWDDIPRSHLGVRSWKMNRKTQYKVK